MNLFIKNKKTKSAFTLIICIISLTISNYSYTQKVEDLSDAQVREFVKRAEASGMSESDIEKYAMSRGYSATDVLKLRERINKINSPNTTSRGNTGQETTSENRKVNEGEKGESQKREDSIEKASENLINNKGVYIYGSHLFNGKNLTFEPNLRLATPKNYILGADDELSVDIYGNSQMSYKLKISPEGTVKIENLQPIIVNGLTIEQASERIINRMKAIYYGLNTQGGGVYAQITLGSIRSIKVTVIGEVAKPGSYTVPSLATVFNVLYQAGGPSKNGSYRNITVIRDNKVIRTMDLYDFLLKADQKDNIMVRDQDVIRIADYDTRVQIKGEIKRPAIFEVNKGETLKTLLYFAGGYTDLAYRNAIKLVRITEKEHKLLTINKDEISGFALEPGDVFEVDSVANTFENRVKIGGAVYRPGDYAIDGKNIKSVKDLINAAGGLKVDAFKNRAIVMREGQFKEPETISFDLEKLIKNEIEDIALQKEDSITIYSVNQLHEKYTVSILGQVNKPKEYEFRSNMTVADLVAEAGGFTQAASSSKIELSRRIKKDTLGTTEWQNVIILEFQVNENLQIIASDSKYILQPFDMVSVKTSPKYEIQQNIFLIGEVAYPGQYIVKDREERIADIMKRAGGIRPSAFTKGATIRRKGEIISVNFQNAIDNESSLDNILLLKGDSINIPRKSETVSIMGGVFNPAIVTYQNGQNVKGYISQAGGFEETALIKKVYVTYPNGSSAKTKSFLFFKKHPKIEPGSVIVVPVVNKDSVQKMSPVEKASIITAFASMVGILFTIINNLTTKTGN
jgi:polysaccharide biosynthesis/export protein